MSRKTQLILHIRSKKCSAPSQSVGHERDTCDLRYLSPPAIEWRSRLACDPEKKLRMAPGVQNLPKRSLVSTDDTTYLTPSSPRKCSVCETARAPSWGTPLVLGEALSVPRRRSREMLHAVAFAPVSGSRPSAVPLGQSGVHFSRRG